MEEELAKESKAKYSLNLEDASKTSLTVPLLDGKSAKKSSETKEKSLSLSSPPSVEVLPPTDQHYEEEEAFERDKKEKDFDLDEEEEGPELEHGEEEDETNIEAHHPRFISDGNEAEEEIEESIAPTTPPSTPRHSAEDEQAEEEEEQSDSEMPEEEEAPKKKAIHYTLLEKECLVPEVFIVWEYICKFIIEKMLEGFAVRIAGLGTFSHVVVPSNVMNKGSSGQFSLRKTRRFPVFKICSHLKQVYRLVEENDLYQCNAPTIPLNVSVVASNAKLSRGIVDGIMIETLQSFVTGIITNKSLEFPFPFIGKLYIKNKTVFMIFYQQFCEGLSFDFDYSPSYVSSTFSGNMTPLAYHRPARGFHSVFHFGDVRSVDDKIAARPGPHAKSMPVEDDAVFEYEFAKNLLSHSNPPNNCSCLRSSKSIQLDDKVDSVNTRTGSTVLPNRYLENSDEIEKTCYTGDFVFQKPDGSSFSPEPLYRSSKSGNLILDRLADDQSLLQQAIGCWMKRQVVKTLGTEAVTKHYDRDYFRQHQNNANDRGNARKNCSKTPSTVSVKTITSSGSTKLSLKSTEMSFGEKQNEEEEENLGEREEQLSDEEDNLGDDGGAILGEVELGLQNNITNFNVKAVRPQTFQQNSKDMYQFEEGEAFEQMREDATLEKVVELVMQSSNAKMLGLNSLPNSKDISPEESPGQMEQQKREGSSSLKQGKNRTSDNFDEFEQGE